MKNDHLESSDQSRPDTDRGIKRSSIRRQRVRWEIRRDIVDSVMEGRFNGAQAARTYSVSEATVHRLVKAEQLANPNRPRLISNQEGRSANKSADGKKTVSGDDRKGRRALTISQEREVVERFYAGSDLPIDLAREYSVHKSTISRVLRAARAQFPSRPTPERDTEEWRRRVNAGVALAMAAGRHAGSRRRLSSEVRETIVIEAAQGSASLSSIARKYGVNPETVRRLVHDRRVYPGPDNPQSLEEILEDLMIATTRHDPRP